jgi:large subunit ribosomal protein L13Ae
MFEKEVVIDGRGHMFGRLASVVAKQLISGQRVTIVRCDKVNISGSLFRNVLKRKEVTNRRNNTNPRRQFVHYKSPSRMLWKGIRGMINHKEAKGAAALAKLKVFEGIPFPYDHKKRVVVPEALKVLRLKSHRKFCSLGDLSAECGWTKAGIVNSLEEKRKAKASKFWAVKSKRAEATKKALGDKSVAAFSAELKKYGF